MNPRVIVYTVGVAVLTGLVFGLAPALQAAKTNLQDSLKDGGRGSAGGVRNRLRSSLVVAEIALSLVLLVGASLFVRSFLNLQDAKAGIETAPLMTLRFYMPGDQYEAPEAMVRRVDDIVRRVEALPGVVAAFASNMVPLSSGGSEGGVVPEGVAIAAGQEPSSSYFGVTPHLLKTLNVPLVAGRDFTDAEGQGRSGVAIVNGTFAKRMWPNRNDVVGQRFRLLDDKQNQWITVIGVVGDFRLFSVRDGKPSPYAFVSYPYDPARNTGLTVRVAGGAPASITSAIRQEIRKADPTLPLFNIRSGEEARLNTFWQFRLFGWMFSIFGAVALVLASIGVYGVLSYAVSQRTQEIGVRMALGASRQNVFALIVSQGAKLAGIGILCGVVGAAAVTRVVGEPALQRQRDRSAQFRRHRRLPRARRPARELHPGAPRHRRRSDCRACAPSNSRKTIAVVPSWLRVRNDNRSPAETARKHYPRLRAAAVRCPIDRHVPPGGRRLRLRRHHHRQRNPRVRIAPAHLRALRRRR